MQTIKIKKEGGQAPSPKRALSKQERKAFDAHLVRGQVMMIVVLVLSGVLIGATAISGLLTARQTRQTADSGSSAVAISAADAGLEWRMYKLYENWRVIDDGSNQMDLLSNSSCADCVVSELACDKKPEFVNNPNNSENINNAVVNVTVECNIVPGPNPALRYYNIVSTAKVKDTSYVFQQTIGLGQ